jgi:hypothetical protein
LRIERSEISENDAFDPTAADVTRSGGLHMYNSAVDLQGPATAMAARSSIPRFRATSRARRRALVAFGNVVPGARQLDGQRQRAAATRTGGIVMSQGDTYPVSGNNTARPALTLVSSILANNSSSGGDVAIAGAARPVHDQRHQYAGREDLFGGTCGTISVQGSGNLTSVGATPGPDPSLGALAYNGGTTRTHALLAGSPAINAGAIRSRSRRISAARIPARAWAVRRYGCL